MSLQKVVKNGNTMSKATIINEFKIANLDTRALSNVSAKQMTQMTAMINILSKISRTSAR